MELVPLRHIISSAAAAAPMGNISFACKVATLSQHWIISFLPAAEAILACWSMAEAAALTHWDEEALGEGEDALNSPGDTLPPLNPREPKRS